MTAKGIYFYLVAFISLFIVLFSAYSMGDLVLRNFVFKTTQHYTYQPPFLTSYLGVYDSSLAYRDPYMAEQETRNKELLENLKNNQSLNDEQRQQIDLWLREYNAWQDEQADVTRRVMDSLISNILRVSVFLPVFVFHYKRAREK